MPPKPPSGQLAPIGLQPSRRLAQLLAGLLFVLAVLAAFGLIPSILRQPLWLLPLLVFWGLLWGSWRAHRRRRCHHPLQLGFEAGEWWLAFPESGTFRAELVGEWLVWPRLLVLPFRLQPGGRKFTLVCLSDSASAEDLRRLRVWLRTRRWLRERT